VSERVHLHLVGCFSLFLAQSFIHQTTCSFQFMVTCGHLLTLSA
jgi:hypothetical protein